MIIEYIKELLGEDAPNDIKLQFYIKTAVQLIKNYLNNDTLTTESIENEYDTAIVLIVENAVNSRNDGVKQIREGDVSITYVDDLSFQITPGVKELLPVPYIEMW